MVAQSLWQWPTNHWSNLKPMPEKEPWLTLPGWPETRDWMALGRTKHSRQRHKTKQTDKAPHYNWNLNNKWSSQEIFIRVYVEDGKEFQSIIAFYQKLSPLAIFLSKSQFACHIHREIFLIIRWGRAPPAAWHRPSWLLRHGTHHKFNPTAHLLFSTGI